MYIWLCIYIYIWTSPKCGYFPSRMGRFGPQCRMYCQMAASRGDAQSILTILTNPLHNRVLIIHNPTKTLKSYESYPFTHHWSQFHRRLFITLSSRNNFTHVPSWILLSSSIHPISPQKNRTQNWAVLLGHLPDPPGPLFLRDHSGCHSAPGPPQPVAFEPRSRPLCWPSYGSPAASLPSLAPNFWSKNGPIREADHRSKQIGCWPSQIRKRSNW